MSAQIINTCQVLKHKFTSNGEAVILTEVPCHPVGGGRIDYMVINMWASRGYSIHGIEEKSFRSDWLRELKSPAKQEKHFKYCDRFWLLTSNENVAKLEEIPETWGWYHINKSGILKVMKEAPKLDAHPIDRFMMCAMVRRAGDRRGFIHERDIDVEIKQRAQTIASQERDNNKWKAENYDSLKRIVDEFESAAGIKLETWKHTPEQIGDKLRLIMENNIDEYVKDLKRLEDKAKNIHEQVKAAVGAFNIKVSSKTKT
jgi:hypothetical protein